MIPTDDSFTALQVVMILSTQVSFERARPIVNISQLQGSGLLPQHSPWLVVVFGIAYGESARLPCYWCVLANSDLSYTDTLSLVSLDPELLTYKSSLRSTST